MAAIDKNKFRDLKKFIKEEPGSSRRLQTLKLPRDLNLAIPKNSKKVFVPNLSAVRNKDKPKEFTKVNEKGKDKPRDRRQNKNKDNGPRFVQSSGVFSEGVGSDVVRTRSWGGVRGEKENDTAPTISMPTIKKDSFQVDKKIEDSVLNKITGCDDESDDEKLPFQPITWQNNIQKTTLINNKIKKELHDDKDVAPDLKKLKLESDSQLLGCSEYLQDESKLDNDKPSISLWGLPDSFAGKHFSDSPDCNKLFDYCLPNMHEGQIGKLVIRKSGRMEVHLGQMKYELEPGDSESYKEDVISIDSQENKSNPKINASILGSIQNRYFLSPDWEKLLN